MKAPFIKDTAAKLQRAAEDFQATEQQIRELQESRLARLLDAEASEIDALDRKIADQHRVARLYRERIDLLQAQLVNEQAEQRAKEYRVASTRSRNRSPVLLVWPRKWKLRSGLRSPRSSGSGRPSKPRCVPGRRTSNSRSRPSSAPIAFEAAQKRGPDECQNLKACRGWSRRALAWRLPGRQERMRVGDQRVIARYPDSRCKNKKAPASRGLVWRKIASPIRLSSSTVGDGLSQGPGFS